jgi:hypothetical protein
MHAQTSSSQIIASIGKDSWERLCAGFVQGGWSALARFVPAAILAGAVASSPTLAADMPQAGRCTVGPGATALLKQVQLRPARNATDIVFTFEGNRIPQPRLRYVTPPILQDPSGNPVQVAGSSFLEINMQPASGVDLSGPQVRQVYAVCGASRTAWIDASGTRPDGRLRGRADVGGRCHRAAAVFRAHGLPPGPACRPRRALTRDTSNR